MYPDRPVTRLPEIFRFATKRSIDFDVLWNQSEAHASLISAARARVVIGFRNQCKARSHVELTSNSAGYGGAAFVAVISHPEINVRNYPVIEK